MTHLKLALMTSLLALAPWAQTAFAQSQPASAANINLAPVGANTLDMRSHQFGFELELQPDGTWQHQSVALPPGEPECDPPEEINQAPESDDGPAC